MSRSKGPGRLYQFMVEQARYRDRIYFCSDHTAAGALNVHRRTIIRWRQTLEADGHIIRQGHRSFGPLKKVVVYSFAPQKRLNVTQRSSSRTTSNAFSTVVRVHTAVESIWRPQPRKRSMTNPQEPPKRAPDLAWEALVRVTHANETLERGKLNAALKGIKDAWASEGGLPEDLPREIELRAEAYHTIWPMLTLTPMALGTHWKRVMAEQQRKTPQQRAIDELRREEQ